MEVAGQYALVTGGAKRIGRSIALSLARAGADVIVHYRSSELEAEETARTCRELGVRSATVRADLSNHEETAALWDEARSQLDAPPTILVNDASVYRRETFHEVTPESFGRAVSVNLRAPLLLTQLMARDLPPLGMNGCVININDSQREYRTRWAYGITVEALSSLTQALSNSTPPEIRVNELRLGRVLTPEDRAGSSLPDPTKPVQLIPVESVGQAVLDLVHDESATGCFVSMES